MSRASRAEAKMNRLDWLDWSLFGLVMGAAIFFRFYHLTDLPLGVVNDAAVNGRDAWRLLNRGGHTPFLAGNGGREAMLVYLQALSIATFGTTSFALRFPTAVADTITVALVFWFAGWLFNAETGPQRRWAALWAGLGMAVSHWLVVVSRLGFRAVLASLLAVPLFWTFLLGWRRATMGWFLLAGLFLALAGYTYSAAKVLPLVLVLVVVLDLIWPDKSLTDRRRFWGLLIMAGTATVVYLPMLIYTVTHPAQTTNRTLSVAIWTFTETPQALVAALWENIILTAGFFCCRGNENLVLFGLPGRPAQDIVLGLLLLVGIGGCLKALNRLEPRLLLLWFFTTWIPTLLAIEAPHPLRLIGAAPAMALLIAYGMHFLTRERRWPALFLTAWFVVAGSLTFRDYFIRWPALAETQTLFNYSTVEQVAAIKAKVNQGDVIYLPRETYVRPAWHYYLNGPFPPQPVDHLVEKVDQVTFWGKGGAAWVRLSPVGAQILPPLQQMVHTDQISQINQINQPNQNISSSLGEGVTTVKIGGQDLVWGQAEQSVDYQIGPAKLVGTTFAVVIPSQRELGVTLFWEAVAPMREDYEILVHLLDDRGQGWSVDETVRIAKAVYPTSYWRPGRDRIPDYHQLRLQDDLPVGRYRLAVSIFDPVQEVRFPVIAAQTDAGAPDTVFLGPLKVPLSPSFEGTIEPDYITTGRFEGTALLRGYSLTGQQLKSAQPLTITFVWQATTEILTDYTVFVHLLDAAGNRVAGHDGQPVQGTYPTAIWSPGEQILDQHRLDLAAVPPGRYHLAVGLYDGVTGERVPVQGAADGRLILAAEIEVMDE